MLHLQQNNAVQGCQTLCSVHSHAAWLIQLRLCAVCLLQGVSRHNSSPAPVCPLPYPDRFNAATTYVARVPGQSTRDAR